MVSRASELRPEEGISTGNCNAFGSLHTRENRDCIHFVQFSTLPQFISPPEYDEKKASVFFFEECIVKNYRVNSLHSEVEPHCNPVP